MKSDSLSSPSASSKPKRFLPCWHGVLIVCVFCAGMMLTFPPFWGCFSEDGYQLQGTNVICHKEMYRKMLPGLIPRKEYENEGASRAARFLEGQSGRELIENEGDIESVSEGTSEMGEHAGSVVGALEDLQSKSEGEREAETFESSPVDASGETLHALQGQEAEQGDPSNEADSLPALMTTGCGLGGAEEGGNRHCDQETVVEPATEGTELGTETEEGLQDQEPSYGKPEHEVLPELLQEEALDSADGDNEDPEDAEMQYEDEAKQQPDVEEPKDNRPHPSCRPSDLIFVYDLPPQFHEDLFNGTCGASNFWSQHPRNACTIYSPEHGGIGPRLTGQEVQYLNEIGSPVESWADTGQFALEVMFHQYMRDSYPCRTFDADQAAAFYVPIYTGMLHHNRTLHCRIDTCQEGWSPLGWLGRLLGAQLNKQRYLRRYQGRDHITTMGHVTFDGLQDDTCCNNGLLKTKHTKHFVIMGIESSVFATVERQVSIPYPTCFHPGTPDDISAHRQLTLSSERPVLASFAGQLDRDGLQWGRNLRAQIARQCGLHPGDCDLLECGMECACSRVLALQLRSKFCLQPTGDSPTRRSLFDSLQAGCIPVLFHRSSAYDEYTAFLPPDETSYSVFIPESDVMQNGVDIIETLRAIPEAELERKRHVIASMLPSISYEDHARAREQNEIISEPLGERSAYEVAIAEALRRVQKAKETV